jgi:hypothetical protein
LVCVFSDCLIAFSHKTATKHRAPECVLYLLDRGFIPTAVFIFFHTKQRAHHLKKPEKHLSYNKTPVW